MSEVEVKLNLSIAQYNRLRDLKQTLLEYDRIYSYEEILFEGMCFLERHLEIVQNV